MSFSRKHLSNLLLGKISIHQLPFIMGSAGCLYISRQSWLNIFLLCRDLCKCKENFVKFWRQHQSIFKLKINANVSVFLVRHSVGTDKQSLMVLIPLNKILLYPFSAFSSCHRSLIFPDFVENVSRRVVWAINWQKTVALFVPLSLLHSMSFSALVCVASGSIRRWIWPHLSQ